MSCPTFKQQGGDDTFLSTCQIPDPRKQASNDEAQSPVAPEMARPDAPEPSLAAKPKLAADTPLALMPPDGVVLDEEHPVRFGTF